MLTRIKSAVLAAALLCGTASAAHSAVFITSATGAPDPGPAAVETSLIDFNGGLLPAGVLLSGEGLIVSGKVANQYAAPAGDATSFLAVGSDGSGTAELDFTSFLGGAAVTQFSFYWGSVDAFNTVQLLDTSGGVLFTVNGAMLPMHDGGQLAAVTNRRITFTLTGADQQLGGLRFISTRPAFEVDDISFATAVAVVPEPVSWAMLIVGFGGVGGIIRRRGAMMKTQAA